MTRDLARREGVLCGVSGGASVAAALTLAEDVPSGSVILAMIPDTGERYLSTPLFDDVPVDMTEEEQAIAATAPIASRPASSRTPAAPISDAARAFVRETTQDPANPVLMFGFEWCEFCWSVRRLFIDAGVPFKAIDVDAAAYRIDDRGGDILRALFDETGMRTVPQVFIGGSLVGGATEVLAAAGDGELARKLEGLGDPIAFRPVRDPMLYLPKWSRRTSLPASAA